MAKIKYTDGNDYSHLEPNIDSKDEHGHDVDECNFCGEESNITILHDKDICHSCGYVYT